MFSTVYWPGGRTYLITSGLQIARGIAWISERGIRGAKIRNSGTTAAIYTATYLAGVFTDNLNQTTAQIVAGTDAQGLSINNIVVEQTGVIAGNAPSGAEWNAVVHLNGAYDSTITDLRVDATANNTTDGLRLRNSFRHHLVRPYIVRGSVGTGGIGINSLEQNNASSAIDASVQGLWTVSYSIDNNGDVSNAYTLINPRIEGNVAAGTGTGLRCTSRAIQVFGGYIEGRAIPIVLGVTGGEACRGARIEGTFVGTDVNTVYLVQLNNVQESYIHIVPQSSYTVSSDEFLSGTVAAGNYGNTIEWHSVDADDGALPADLGLANGANILRVHGRTQTNGTAYQEYLTTTATLHRTQRHVNRVIAEDYVRLGTVTFESLVADSAFTIRACSNCQVTSGADNTCATGGTGALAVRIGAAWRCFALQN